jgi:hypothetical protein
MLAEGLDMVILRVRAASGNISFWGGGQGVWLDGFLGLEPIVTQLCELKALVTWWAGRVLESLW